MKFQLYTDGGYSMSGDLGAFAYVILHEGELLQKYSQKIVHETNNRAEIKAILYGIQALPDKSEVDVFSDSQYALGVLSGRYRAKKNPDLVSLYKKIVVTKGMKVSYNWVRGHDGDEWNELCDAMCNEAAGLDLNYYPTNRKSKEIDLSKMEVDELYSLLEKVQKEIIKRQGHE